MQPELVTAPPASPSASPAGAAVDPRVEIARLTLRLRQALRRIDEASEAAAVDLPAARSSLVERLGPMLDERRAQLEAELAAVRAEAATLVDAATRDAASIVRQAEAESVANRDRLATDHHLARQRQIEHHMAEQRLAEQRLAEQRAAEQRLAEQRVAEQRVAEQRVAEQRLAEQRAAEQRAIEQHMAEQRLAEQRAAEQRLAEQVAGQQFLAEQQVAERHLVEQRAAEQRTAELRVAEQRLADQRAAQQRALEQRAAEQRMAEQWVAEQRAAEQRAAEQMAAQQAAERQAAELQAAEQRLAEQRAAEQWVAEQRAAEQRAAQERAAAQLAAEQREAERRAAEQRALELWAAEQQAAEQRRAHEHLDLSGSRHEEHRNGADSDIWAASNGRLRRSTDRGRRADDGSNRQVIDIGPIREADVPTGQVPIVLADSPLTDSASPWAPSAAVVPAAPTVPAETRLVVDAEAFAQVFATTIASIMREWSPGQQGQPGAALQQAVPQAVHHAAFTPGVQYVAAPHQVIAHPVAAPAASGGFWANARHLDVLLLGFTSVIVMVVLGAWLA